MTNEHRKPTALEEMIDPPFGWQAIPQATIDAARRELEIKTELCEAYEYARANRHEVFSDAVVERTARLRDARDAYRTWRAEQEKQS